MSRRDVEILRWLATQIVEPLGEPVLEIVYAKHRHEIANWPVSESGIPYWSAAEFLREQWPSDAGEVPADHVLVALAIVIADTCDLRPVPPN